MLLPGLTASGAALLFGVNAWCLDGKGMVWRETLPVSAADVFDVRALVVAECMAMVSGVTVVLAAAAQRAAAARHRRRRCCRAGWSCSSRCSRS